MFPILSFSQEQIGSDINGELSDDRSGRSVSMSANGTIVAIGASYADGIGTNSGNVRVYDLTVVLASDSFVQANFKVYPNPTTDKVTIELKEGLQIEKVNVYSTLGQLVKTEKDTVISVGDLAKGTYYLEVVTNQGKAAKTIVVE
ncbi:T9SS type A sorting domain-containing protein [Flavobacterium sp. SM15]|uniref:T9SS type A sorting domain-containing protein n=1 Tax=Flavobacterium sp. SM15 TaxID=2908005 RepID=UPI001ED9EA32|nr:T9SS type A sorting domain-containing protein [Flavobacterium sp. SM15]MCG2612464.1 T9SS type A sorting domain-containing protein [Flavobacterium sp. SM15]